MDFNMVSTLQRLRESIVTLKYSCFRAKCDRNLHENHLIHPSARLLQRSRLAPKTCVGADACSTAWAGPLPESQEKCNRRSPSRLQRLAGVGPSDASGMNHAIRAAG